MLKMDVETNIAIELDGFRWDQSPRCYPNSNPVVDKWRRAAFQSCQTAAEHFIRGDGGQLSFFIEGAMAHTGVVPVLPSRNDKDFTAYHQRMGSHLSQKEYSLFMGALQQYHCDLWDGCAALLEPLYRQHGLPSKGVNLELVAGRYTSTPLGIHRDTANNFMVVLEGTKTMYFWPADFFDTKETVLKSGWVNEYIDVDEIAPYLDGAIKIDAKAGDVIYWPRSYWHAQVAEPVFSVVLNVALFTQYQSQQLLGQVQQSLIQDCKADNFKFNTRCCDTLSDLDQTDMGAFLLNLEKVIGDKLSFYSYYSGIEQFYLNKSTGYAFLQPLVSRPHSLAQGDCVRKRNDYGRLLYVEQGGDFFVSCNGQSIAIEYNPSHLKLLESLSNDNTLYDVNADNLELLNFLYQRYFLVTTR